MVVRRDENMNDRRNVIVMFLLIMLSFAIITEVSAAGEAEINGTGPHPSMMPDGIVNPDVAGERFNQNQMQDHFDADDFQYHDGQKSCIKTPQYLGDNKCNETLYENMDLNKSPEFKHSDNMSNGMSDGVKPEDDMSDGMFDERKHLNVSEFEFNDKALGEFNSSDLRNNNFTDLTKNGELMNDVVSNLIGLNNVVPNFSKNDKNVSPNNANDLKPMGDKCNESAPLITGGKNTSDIGSFNIDKNTKTQKIIKKVKSIKKPKKVNKKIFKKSRKERAKL